MSNTLFGKDVRHINPLIDQGHPEVKAYIESIEDYANWLEEILVYVIEDCDDEYWQQLAADLRESITANEERNERTRK